MRVFVSILKSSDVNAFSGSVLDTGGKQVQDVDNWQCEPVVFIGGFLNTTRQLANVTFSQTDFKGLYLR